MKVKFLWRTMAVTMAAAMSLSLCATTALAAGEGDSMGPPPGGGPGDEGGMSGAMGSEMPSEENTDRYYEDESEPIVIGDYAFYSERFADSAIAAKGCTALTVGDGQNHYTAAQVSALSDTTAEYVNRYAADDEGFSGYIVLGAEDNGDTAGNGISVNSGNLNVNNMYIQTSGAIGQSPSGRYGIATLENATTVVNDSYVIHTGATEATEENSVPASNAGLLISGRGRSNFSIGATTTMYFNSTVVAEGWAAMSTDSATGDGLDFYSYNSKAYAENGGYGVYSDTNCRDYLYATDIEAAEIGVIISNNGNVYVGSGADAGADLLAYNTGEVSDAPSVIRAGRNDYQLHSPDMMGEGTGTYQGVMTVENSELITTRDLKSAMDYTAEYDEAVGAYIDYVSGANILVKSTGAVIDLNNVTAESYSNTLLLTALNSDSMSRYLKSEGTDDVEMTISNSTIGGDIQHDDYQRDVNVTLKDSEYSGAVDYSTYDEWNAMWESVEDCEYNYWSNLDPATYITDTHDTVMNLEDSAWNVTGDSNVTDLTMDDTSSVVVPEGVTLVVESGDYAGTYTNTTLMASAASETGTLTVTPAALEITVGETAVLTPSLDMNGGEEPGGQPEEPGEEPGGEPEDPGQGGDIGDIDPNTLAAASVDGSVVTLVFSGMSMDGFTYEVEGTDISGTATGAETVTIDLSAFEPGTYMIHLACTTPGPFEGKTQDLEVTVGGAAEASLLMSEVAEAAEPAEVNTETVEEDSNDQLPVLVYDYSGYDENVISVTGNEDGTGTVTGVAAGTTVITVTAYVDGQPADSVEVPVTVTADDQDDGKNDGKDDGTDDGNQNPDDSSDPNINGGQNGDGGQDVNTNTDGSGSRTDTNTSGNGRTTASAAKTGDGNMVFVWAAAAAAAGCGAAAAIGRKKRAK